MQPIQAAPYFAHAQFSAPRATLALPDPGDELPFVKAMWHYARGVAYAAGKNVAAAQRRGGGHRAAQGKRFADLAAGGIPAADILELARAGRAGAHRAGGGKLEAAVQPSSRRRDPGQASLLGAAALVLSGAPIPRRRAVAQGRLEAAEEAFRDSLAQAPNNGWALYGLSESIVAWAAKTRLRKRDGGLKRPGRETAPPSTLRGCRAQ